MRDVIIHKIVRSGFYRKGQDLMRASSTTGLANATGPRADLPNYGLSHLRRMLQKHRVEKDSRLSMRAQPPGIRATDTKVAENRRIFQGRATQEIILTGRFSLSLPRPRE